MYCDNKHRKSKLQLGGTTKRTRATGLVSDGIYTSVKIIPMYGGLSMSAPSLHRESTDSLIQDTEQEDISSLLLHAVGDEDVYILSLIQ